MILKEGLLERGYLTSVLTRGQESFILESCRRVFPQQEITNLKYKSRMVWFTQESTASAEPKD